jgi:anti-sigma factor RsiW
MDCNAYHVLMTGYIDGELSGDEMQMLKTHLQTCEACLTYLKHLETLETLLKRYHLFQEISDVPADFAHNMSVKLQEVIARERIPLGAKLKEQYRGLVLGIVERWANSLRTRPLTWVTSVSFLVVCIAGIVFVDIFQTVYQDRSLRSVKVAPEPGMQVAPKDKAPVGQASPRFSAVEPSSGQRDETEIALQAPVEEKPLQSLKIVVESAERGKIHTRSVVEKESIQPAAITPEPVIRAAKQDKVRESVIRLAVRTESYTINGNVAVLSALSELSFQPKLPKEIFTLTVPKGIGVQTPVEHRFQSVEAAQKHINFQILEPKYLPSGFILSSVLVFQTNQGEILQLTYSDKMSSISVFEDTQLSSISDSLKNGRAITINTPVKETFSGQGLLKILDWHLAGGMHITLVGEVADGEFLKIASSIGNP